MNDTASLSEREFADKISSWRKALLVSHAKPDGDALGALVGMYRLLRSRGVDAVVVVFDPIPDRYTFLLSSAPVQTLGRDAYLLGRSTSHNAGTAIDPATLDGILILDTCAHNQLEPIADWLRETALPKLVIDHHATRDKLADHYLIDESAAATCLIIHELAREAAWSIDAETANALFVGIGTDTGWFHHSNTDARVFAACAELVERGARPNALYERLFHQEMPGRFRLRAAAIQRVELECENQLAVMTLPKTIFVQCGATLGDTEDLVNEPMRIATVIVSLMFVEQDNGVVRVGLRSREPLDDQMPEIDVAQIAKTWGGGGHRRAAGARVNGTLEEARRKVTEAVIRSLRSQ